ncbi:hypothetical protein [Erythrobacter sanguineus]|uniref:Conserved repeat domain-containing protein n=1 Tax=Erythrobacter sanguineus TaxID=198312 RepID=A0A1M7S6T1_9SPHN|nr:hypothetical protein [Erythrobacter sanguineus]SHN54065.1 conserved repeat domain-containing protein [Erythrobacter sanguineus]
MKTTKQLLGAVSALALVAMSSAPALAEGTSAGSTITNNVSVTFDVGGVTQTAVTDSDEFTVDRRVNVNVEWVGTATSVAPGAPDQVIAFDVTNLSNDTIDLDLAAALTDGTPANIGGFEIYLDSDGDRILSAAELAAGPISYLDEVAEDGTIAVIVIADIGIDAVNGDAFDVTLTANAHAGGGAGALGAELVATSGANTAGVDTVLFDGAGATDAANDGAFSDTGEFVVAGALVTVAKSSRVLADPVNDFLAGGAANPNAKAIPGATVEYCITVANASGGALATNVDVVDDLPFDVTYDGDFGIFVDGDANCANGLAGGNFSAGTGPNTEDQVLGDLSDIAEGITRSLYFRVTID